MIYRTITADDAQAFHRMMCLLDEETDFMMFEPGEREARPGDVDRLRTSLETASGWDFLMGAVTEDGEIVGYLWAQRGRPNRIRHTAHIVIGIREAYRRQGIGSELFGLLDTWAREGGVVRLELTVECANIAAIGLYEKCGFKVEGLRPESMCVSGRLVDEYYMGKVLG